MTSSSIPNSFSADDLQSAYDQALKEDTAQKAQKDPFSRDTVMEVAKQCVENATKVCPDPIVHKVMAWGIISKMIDWHVYAAEACIEAGDLKVAGCWMRDAGKLQAMLDIFTEIEVGSNDFIWRELHDED